MEAIVVATLVILATLSVMVILVFAVTPSGRLLDQLQAARCALDTVFFELQRERAGRQKRLRLAADQHVFEWRERLRNELPAESLKAIGAENVRWSSLESGGVKTLADLTRQRGALTSIQGVGEVSVERLLEAADRAEKALESLPTPPPRLDSSDEVQVELLEAAAGQLQIRDVHSEVTSELSELDARLKQHLAEAHGIFDWLRSPGAASRRAEQTQSEVGELEERIEKLAASVKTLLSKSRNSASPHTRTDEVRELIEDALPGKVYHSKYGQGLLEDEAQSVDEFVLKNLDFGVTLRTYQEFGARFMLYYRRTLIGDEMGLGKTIQALAAIRHLEHAGATHFLVVAPAGVIYNWAHESVDKARLPVVMLHGTGRDFAVNTWLESGGLGVTSYATLRTLDLAARIDRLDMLIADEAHYVKNPEAQRSQAIWDLAQKSDYVSFMTGTPIENRVEEFVRLVQPLDHEIHARLTGMLGLETDDAAESPMQAANNAEAALVTDQDADSTTTVAMALLREARGHLTEYVVPPTAFRRMVRHVYLRRTQRDVLTELPHAILKNEWVDLSPAERVKYDDSVRAKAFMTMRRLASTGAGARGAKYQHVDALLEDYRTRGHKVVVFSYFRDTLDALESLADVHGRIDGSVSAEDRADIIRGFWRAPGHSVLLGQIKSAGVGINLQCASAVVLMEPQIKPSLEDQAIARVVRMGQQHRVVVHRLLAEHTVEEHLEKLLHEKRVEFEIYAQQSLAKEAHKEATDQGLVTQVVEIEYQRVLREAPVE